MRGEGAALLIELASLTMLLVTDFQRQVMAEAGKSKSSRERVRRYRVRLREQGLRPIQIWVPDVRAPGFGAEAHGQSRAVADSPQASEDQAFTDAVSELGDA